MDGRATCRIHLTCSIRLLMTKCRNLLYNALPGLVYEFSGFLAFHPKDTRHQ